MGDSNADVIDLHAIVARLYSLDNEIQVLKKPLFGINKLQFKFKKRRS